MEGREQLRGALKPGVLARGEWSQKALSTLRLCCFTVSPGRGKSMLPIGWSAETEALA